MILRITIIWIIGGLIIIPYAVYRLLFEAQSDEYAFLIVMPLFWVFGFWGVVGPIVAAYRFHQLMKALEQVQDRQTLQAAYEKHAGKEVMVDLIANENRIPKFMVRMFYDKIETKLRQNSFDAPTSGKK